MRTLKTLVLILPLLMMLILARPSAAQDGDDAEQKEDFYLVTLTTQADMSVSGHKEQIPVEYMEGTMLPRTLGGYEQRDRRLAKFGPLKVIVRLQRVPGPYVELSDAKRWQKWMDIQWELNQRDREYLEEFGDTVVAEKFRHSREESNAIRRRAIKVRERFLEDLETYLPDIQLMDRLFHGLTHYAFVDGPASGFFEGASWHLDKQSLDQGKVIYHSETNATAAAWNRDDVTEMGLGKDIRLIVWRFAPEDMERIRELMADSEKVEAVFSVLPDEDKYLEQTGRRYRNTLLRNLAGIMETVWGLTPNELPDDVVVPVRPIKAGSLRLPPTNTGTLMRLEISGNPFYSVDVKVSGSRDTRSRDNSESKPIHYTGKHAHPLSRLIGVPTPDFPPPKEFHISMEEMKNKSSGSRQYISQFRSRMGETTGVQVAKQYERSPSTRHNCFLTVKAEVPGDGMSGSMSAEWKSGQTFADSSSYVAWNVEHDGPTTRVAPGAAPEARP